MILRAAADLRRISPSRNAARPAHFLVLRYDRGNDSQLAAKIVRESGNLQVGVNATDNRWDLFPTVDNAREVTGLRPFEQR